jgi:hypothetical protein
MWTRADGAQWCRATGWKGTYERVLEDGLWSAYFYPEGDQARGEELIAPQPSDGLGYQVCVDHNKIGLDVTAVAPDGQRKRDRAAMCPDCFMVHAGECP